MPSRTRTLAADAGMPALMVGAAAAAAAVCVVLAYVISPVVAVGVPVALCVVAAVFVRPINGLYAGVLTAPLESMNLPLGNVAGLSVSETIFLLTAVVVAVQAAFGRRAWQAPAPAHVAFAALILVAATGLAFAGDAVTVAKIVLMWSVYLVLSMHVASASREELRRLFTCVAVAAGIVGAMAIPNAEALRAVGGGTTVENRATASFNQPNILGFFLVLSLGPALALALGSRGRWRPAMGVAVLLILGGLTVSLSRGSIIGAAVSLAIMLALPAFRKVVAVLLLGLVVAGFAGGGGLLHSQQATVVRTRLSSIGRETTTNPRLEIYRAGPSMVAARPLLGAGEGNFPEVSAEFGLRDADGSVFAHAHDILLTIAVETGLAGLAAFLAFLISMGQTILRAIRRLAGDDRMLALGIAAALAGLFVTGITDYPFGNNLVMALIMLEVGAMVAYARGHAAPARQPTPPRPALALPATRR